MSQTPIKYKASPTLAKFHASKARIRLAVGPFGSGKSTATIMELFRLANCQVPCLDGVRRSRYLIGRNTYRELRDTTLPTFHDWIPEDMGVFSASDFTFTLKSAEVECEFMFRSFDTPRDVGKLLSLDISGGWLNEARQMPRPIFDALTGRIGRYPRAKFLQRPQRKFLVLDTNPSDRLHWLYRIFVQERPAGFELFHQPSGLAPNAENIENLTTDYYKDLAVGKDSSWIKVYVEGDWGYTQEGLPIFPQFNERVHVAPQVLKPTDAPIIVGIDFGLTPAAAIMQKRAGGGYNVLSEIVTDRASARDMGIELKRHLAENYYGLPAQLWGDPAGSQGGQNDMSTCFDALAGVGLQVTPAPTNVFATRREATAMLLRTIQLDGYPGLYFSPSCTYLVMGMGGGYHYRSLANSGTNVRYSAEPDKNQYSHICEALGYGVVGEGEGYELRGKREQKALDYSRNRRATAGA